MSTHPASHPDAKLKAAEDHLRGVMLALPEVTEEFPWGHRTAKVKGKMFAVLVLDDTGLSVTTKLPHSNEAALMLPFAEPTGYGLGRSGWVSSSFKPGEAVPVELLAQWIHESFRAVAPQKVLKALGGAGPAPVAKKAPAGKAPARKAAAKAPVKKAAVKRVAAAKTAPAKKAPARMARRGSPAASRSKR